MCRLIFSSNLTILYLAYLFSNVCFSRGSQETYSLISKDIETLLKIEDQANQQLKKNRMCEKANITNQVPVLEDNVIKVIFKLRDKKFQHCFNYFKIFLEKKRKVIKEVKVPYLHEMQEEISYKFENISCGIYEVFVQPCFDDRNCPLFRWLYQKSINVTSNECMSILKNKITSDDENDVKVHALFIVVCFTVPVALGTLFHIYKRGPTKHKYTGYEYCAADYNNVKVEINKNFRKKIKSINIHILHKYDKKHKIEKKVLILKENLKSYLKFLFCDILRDVDSPVNIHMKTIDSELLETTCLDNVNNWFESILKKREKDGILQRCILVESNLKMEDDDIVENEIFFHFETKLSNLKNNNEVFLRTIQLNDQLLLVGDLTVHSIQTTVPDNSHPYYDLLDYCFDVCSEFVIPATKDSFEALVHQHLHRQPNKLQNSPNLLQKII